jgi:hypothetical protein
MIRKENKMLPEELNGLITKQKWERLIKHLHMVEEQTGRKLRMTPRLDEFTQRTRCPILCFAPGRDSNDYYFTGCHFVGHKEDGLISLSYGDAWGILDYPILYELGDTQWWEGLSTPTKMKILRAVSKYLKEYYSNLKKGEG